MTSQEFNLLMATIDGLWGGLDEVLQAGYEFLIQPADQDLTECLEVVRLLAQDPAWREHKDSPFVPKAPEFKRALDRFQRERANWERINQRIRELETPTPPPALSDRQRVDLTRTLQLRRVSR